MLLKFFYCKIKERKYSIFFKDHIPVLTGVVHLVGNHTSKQEVTSLIPGFPVSAHSWVSGSVPGGGMCERQPIDVSLSYQ